MIVRKGCIFFCLSVIHVVYGKEAGFRYRCGYRHAVTTEAVVVADAHLDDSAMVDWCDSLADFFGEIRGQVCYAVHRKKATWSAAVSACRDKGGQLFKPDNKQKAAFVLRYPGLSVVWGAAKEHDGKFYWMDGTPVVSDLWDKAISVITDFKGWFASRTLCMTLWRQPFANSVSVWWKKSDCSDEHAYVCKHDVDSAFKQVPIPADGQTKAMANAPSLLGIPSSRPKNTSKQHVYKGIKTIKSISSPKLKAKPDVLLTQRGSTDCARACTDEKCCKLFNHFPPKTCVLYCDVKRAKEKGANSVLGSRIWVFHRS